MWAGTGRHVKFFNDLGFSVVGTEISQDIIDGLTVSFVESSFVKCRANSIPLRRVSTIWFQ